MGYVFYCVSEFPYSDTRVCVACHLISLPRNDFHVILGMDWLTGYHAVMDCFDKTMKLKVDDTDKKV